MVDGFAKWGRSRDGDAHKKHRYLSKMSRACYLSFEVTRCCCEIYATLAGLSKDVIYTEDDTSQFVKFATSLHSREPRAGEAIITGC